MSVLWGGMVRGHDEPGTGALRARTALLPGMVGLVDEAPPRGGGAGGAADLLVRALHRPSQGSREGSGPARWADVVIPALEVRGEAMDALAKKLVNNMTADEAALMADAADLYRRVANYEEARHSL